MKALVLFSGGVDSTTCLAIAVDKYGKDNVLALSISYGQKHSKETEAAEKIAAYYGVPRESYAEQLEKTDGKPVSTYVPFRNGLFLSCAASVALSNGCTEIYYGVHSDDAAGNAYPDCSIDFNNAINSAIYIGSGNQLKVIAPFVSMNKADVVAKGLSLKVPYKMTWSCYEGGEKPCGICGTCRDRIAAFKANGITEE